MGAHPRSRWRAAIVPRSLSALVAAMVFVGSALAQPAGEAACGEAPQSCAALVYEGLTYPFAREPGSYLYVDGGIYPYVEAGEDLFGAATVAMPDGSAIRAGDLLEALGLGDMADERLVPIAGYGSNPAPAQLARKFRSAAVGEPVVMAVMKGEIEGYDVVWTPFFAPYGGMPSTLFPSPGTTVDIWVNWMREADVKRMDATEGLADDWYRRVPLKGARTRFDGPEPPVLEVYVSCFGAFAPDGAVRALSAVPARGRRFAALSSMEALRMALPALGAADVLSLVYANVSDAAVRRANTRRLGALGVFEGADGPFARDACGRG